MLDEYLETLPEPVIARLFQSPASCLALLRLLSPLAKAIVMRLLYTAKPTPVASLERLVDSKHRRIQVEALQKLRSLKIVRERFTTNTIEINSVFQSSLRMALTCGRANETFEAVSRTMPVDFLREVQQRRWETMLHYMVSSAQNEEAVVPTRQPRNSGLSSTTMALLVKSGLLSRSRRITSEGFQFLLQDQQTQVWTLLLHYLNNAAELEMDPVDILNFIFRLGTLELGKGHSTRGLPEPHQRVLSQLAELGIVYVPDDDPEVFFAAMELTSDPAGVEKNAGDADGFIIVETNYRLYAYTCSPLQTSILNLFCSLRSRFANLVIGRLTRHSARRALANGITADQILQYLTTNHRGGGALPPTIIDQIKLWQLEMDRFRQASGYLFRDFASAKEYSVVAGYAQDVGALLWRNDRTRMFFVDERSATAVTEFVNRSKTVASEEQ